MDSRGGPFLGLAIQLTQFIPKHRKSNMPSITDQASTAQSDRVAIQHEISGSIREQTNNYLLHMIDLMFQGQIESMRFMREIHSLMLKNGKALSSVMSQNNAGNGYTSSQSAASNGLIQSMIDVNELMMDLAQSTAVQSAHLVKIPFSNHHGGSNSVMAVKKQR